MICNSKAFLRVKKRENASILELFRVKNVSSEYHFIYWKGNGSLIVTK